MTTICRRRYTRVIYRQSNRRLPQATGVTQSPRRRVRSTGIPASDPGRGDHGTNPHKAAGETRIGPLVSADSIYRKRQICKANCIPSRCGQEQRRRVRRHGAGNDGSAVTRRVPRDLLAPERPAGLSLKCAERRVAVITITRFASPRLEHTAKRLRSAAPIWPKSDRLRIGGSTFQGAQ